MMTEKKFIRAYVLITEYQIIVKKKNLEFITVENVFERRR